MEKFKLDSLKNEQLDVCWYNQFFKLAILELIKNLKVKKIKEKDKKAFLKGKINISIMDYSKLEELKLMLI